MQTNLCELSASEIQCHGLARHKWENYALRDVGVSGRRASDGNTQIKRWGKWWDAQKIIKKLKTYEHNRSNGNRWIIGNEYGDFVVWQWEQILKEENADVNGNTNL